MPPLPMLVIMDIITEDKMNNRFEKYKLYLGENESIININEDALDLANEAFELFKSLFNYDYGSIDEDENLISIHTGGFSENEELISELKETGWWIKNHEITAAGGHYYFNTDFMDGYKSWDIRAVGENSNVWERRTELWIKEC